MENIVKKQISCCIIEVEYKEKVKNKVNLGKNIFFTEVYFDKKTKMVYI